MALPARTLQESFWDTWNVENRTEGHERQEYTYSQLRVAQRAAGRLRANGAASLRILDFGCGTGWLGGGLTAYGDVTGIDLSPASIEYARSAHPQVRFLQGDVLELDVGGPFDLIVSADVISHVADQQRFVDRVAELLRADGKLLLMTQNGAIWRRNSQLMPQQPGQIRNWPSLRALRVMLAPAFELERVGTIHPMGDRGVLRVVNSRWISGPLRRVGLRHPWRRARELARLGCEFTIEARKR